VGAAGLAAGTILGGLLTSASWRLTFFVNVPLVVLCAAGAMRWFGRAYMQAHRTTSHVPLLASVLGTGAVLALVAGLSLSSNQGWDTAPPLLVLGLAVVLTLGFVLNEQVSQRVLIEPVLRRTSSLRMGAAGSALYMASVGSEFYLVTLLLQ